MNVTIETLISILPIILFFLFILFIGEMLKEIKNEKRNKQMFENRMIDLNRLANMNNRLENINSEMSKLINHIEDEYDDTSWFDCGTDYLWKEFDNNKVRCEYCGCLYKNNETICSHCGAPK